MHDLGGGFRPADLASWYAERGFHFYLASLSAARAADVLSSEERSRIGLSRQFASIDAACAHLSQADGIDAIILSGHGSAARTAALWCAARRQPDLVHALILSSPVFGGALRRDLDIGCPVLVLWAGSPPAGKPDRSPDAARIGRHVTSLHLATDLAGDVPGSADSARLFDEMGRWLGAYMYGKLGDRDRLL